jgi:hypothetical protein
VEAIGIKNIFNKIIAENFPNVEKGMVFQAQEVFRTPSRKEPPQGILYIKH